MALNLDTRQRAMLQEMGITLWLPQPASVSTAVLSAVQAPALRGSHAAVAQPAVRAVVAPAHAPVTAPAVSTVEGHTPAKVPQVVETAIERLEMPKAELSVPAWRQAPAVQLYPGAVPQSGHEAWLIVWECPNAAQPLQGDAGQLLGHILRALRLHHNPQVWLAPVQHPERQTLQAAGLPSDALQWQPLEQGLAQAVQHIRPARMLLLGLHAARAVLGNEEALGRLRAQIHSVMGVPAVVSYDPSYLLRAPHAKPSAWADWCRAHDLRPPSQ